MFTSKKFTILEVFLFIFVFFLTSFTFPLFNGYSINHPINMTMKPLLAPHGAILIDSDDDFLAFTGGGTANNPYRIEDLNITTTDFAGIYIMDTTKYFLISNCFVDAQSAGIFIQNVADNTTKIVNNICKNNNMLGIVVESSNNATIINNTCSNNLWGININDADFTIAENNTCIDNIENGLVVQLSNGVQIINNTCLGNDIDGFVDFQTTNTILINNTCIDNSRYGIYILNSQYTTVNFTRIKENDNYGVYVDNSDDCNIHHNTLIDNGGGTSQAYDVGTNNFWYDATVEEGNYWSDWSGTGSYSIDGAAGSVDLYPFRKPIEFDAPTISNIIYSPIAPTELDTICINATVFDLAGIKNATLHYRVDGGMWSEINMIFVQNDLYKAIIGPFTNVDVLEFYISAFDNSDYYNEEVDDNNGAYYSITFQDTSKPIISNINHTPNNPTDSDSVTISCEVTDETGVASVSLNYRVNSGSWQLVIMSFLSSSTYEAVIGPFVVGSIIEYYVTAIDSSINANEAIDNNESNYYSFESFLNDITAPDIDSVSHTPENPTDVDYIAISCVVSDDASGIASITVFYRINEGTWINKTMTIISDSIYGSLIGPFEANSTIEYYIKAIDDSSNHNIAIDNNSGNYYRFVVEGQSTENGIFPYLFVILPAFALILILRKKKEFI